MSMCIYVLFPSPGKFMQTNLCTHKEKLHQRSLDWLMSQLFWSSEHGRKISLCAQNSYLSICKQMSISHKIKYEN